MEGVKLVPVKSDDNIRTLREFRKLLQSTMGPSGGYKVLVTRAGYSELTASSTSLLERLEIESPICKYISQVAKGLPNYGLYFGVLVSSLLEQRWTSEKDIEPHIFSEITEFLRKALSSEMVCRKVDFGSINSFFPLVKSVLCSKGEQAIDLNIDKLCYEILKVFLICVDEKTNLVGRVHIKVEEGSSRVSSYDGLMYEMVEDEDLSIVQFLKGEVRIVIFTLPLNLENENNALNIQLMKTVERIADSKVSVVACQKTVANEIKLFLRRRNILLVERMGTDFTNLLLQASNAFPISQLSFGFEDLEKMLGVLTSLELVEFGDRKYTLFRNKETSIGTLLVHSRNLLVEDHLKGLIHQAMNSLRSLASNPLLTFGAGCLEIWLIGQLALFVQEHRSRPHLPSVARWLQTSLLLACGPSPPTALDSLHHHGWPHTASPHCCCGAVSQSSVGQLIHVSELISCSAVSCVNPPTPTQLADDAHTQTHVVVDLHQHKHNAVLSALETFANLGDIGMVLYDCK